MDNDSGIIFIPSEIEVKTDTEIEKVADDLVNKYIEIKTAGDRDI